jgi:phytoene desaturase
MKRAVVIGAGFAGMSAAALLARRGFAVTVVEKNGAPGGRASSFAHGGYRFDMGPSWYLMPEVFERFFRLFGKEVSEYYQLERLDPSYKVFFRTREALVRSSLEENRALFDELEPGGGEKLDRYLERASYQYRVAMERFIYKRYDRLTDFFSRSSF